MTWINHASLGRNGPHCVECLHEMGKLLMNLVPGEPLALVREFSSFENPIQLDLILESVINLCVHDPISCGMFHAFWA